MGSERQSSARRTSYLRVAAMSSEVEEAVWVACLWAWAWVCLAVGLLRSRTRPWLCFSF